MVRVHGEGFSECRPLNRPKEGFASRQCAFVCLHSPLCGACVPTIHSQKSKLLLRATCHLDLKERLNTWSLKRFSLSLPVYSCRRCAACFCVSFCFSSLLLISKRQWDRSCDECVGGPGCVLWTSLISALMSVAAITIHRCSTLCWCLLLFPPFHSI